MRKEFIQRNQYQEIVGNSTPAAEENARNMMVGSTLFFITSTFLDCSMVQQSPSLSIFSTISGCLFLASTLTFMAEAYHHRLPEFLRSGPPSEPS